MAVLDLIELPLINRLVINEKLIPKGILFSDHLKFQPLLDYFIKNYPTPKPLDRFLIIIRDGNFNVDILHNKNLPLIMTVRPKRWKDPIPIGDIITFNADVQEFITIETKGINISDGDMFIGYISFSDINLSSVFFDLSKERSNKNLNVFLSRSVRKYQRVLFQNAYYAAKLYNKSSDLKPINFKTLQGWFPFKRILGKEFEELYDGIIKFQHEKTRLSHLPIIETFNQERFEDILEDWHKIDIFPYETLKMGVTHYLNGDALSSIRVLIPDIEGIVRNTLPDKFQSLKQSDIPQIIARHSITDAIHNRENLLFINAFRSYLEKIWFVSFSSSNPSYNISRHTVSHGNAHHREYMLEKALQLILTIDQLSFIYSRSTQILDTE